MSENPVLAAIGKQDWLQPVQERGPDLIRQIFSATGFAGRAAKNTLHGVWLGHPLHPAVTDIPVGSWTVAATLDTLDLLGQNKYQAGADAAVLIGLAGAVPAALSGITDWGETHGKPQRVGIVHGILNITATALYTGSVVARRTQKRPLARLLGFLGFGFVVASAYLGGQMSYAQKIGVNHAPDPEGELPKNYVPVISVDELTEGKPTKVTVDNTDIVIVKKGAKVHAMANHCSHLSGPLSEGIVEGDSIICPWHGSRFCLADGHVEDGPATYPQPVLDVNIEAGQVRIRAQQN